jgi:hypothetical protein
MSPTINLPPSKEEAQFRKSADATNALAALLASPQFVMASKIIREEAILRAIPAPMPGVHHDTTVTHYAHFLMGVNACLDRLKCMSIAIREDGTDPTELDDDADDYFTHAASRIQPLKDPAPKADK